MKINNNSNNYNKFLNTINQAKKAQSGLSKKAEEQAPKALNQDQVDISIDAKRLAEMAAQQQRAARVDEIKAQVQNGTYEVKPKEIAEALSRTIQPNKGEK